MPLRGFSLSVHRVVAVSLLLSCALAASLAIGCRQDPQANRKSFAFAPLFEKRDPQQTQPDASEPDQTQAPAPAPADGATPEPIVVIQTRFDILQIRVHKGVFSQSGKIWNHVDEEVIPDATARLLQRNGLRVATGRPDAWPPIRAMLAQEEKTETSSSSMTFANGLPLTISVDQRPPRDQTLFLYRADGSMAGVTCPMSTNLIRIEYGVSIDRPDAVQVDIMPEFRQQQVVGRLSVNEVGQLDHPVLQPTRVLRELAFRVLVPPDEFIVIGPSPSAWPHHEGERGYLAGSLLLCEVVEGRPYESMYFISPRQERSDRKALPPSNRW